MSIHEHDDATISTQSRRLQPVRSVLAHRLQHSCVGKTTRLRAPGPSLNKTRPQIDHLESLIPGGGLVASSACIASTPDIRLLSGPDHAPGHFYSAVQYNQKLCALPLRTCVGTIRADRRALRLDSSQMRTPSDRNRECTDRTIQGNQAHAQLPPTRHRLAAHLICHPHSWWMRSLAQDALFAS